MSRLVGIIHHPVATQCVGTLVGPLEETVSKPHLILIKAFWAQGRAPKRNLGQPAKVKKGQSTSRSPSRSKKGSHVRVKLNPLNQSALNGFPVQTSWV